MENPFPGMNPYLEEHWPDVHHRVITYACDQLAGRLPKDLRARIGEHVFVQSEAGDEHRIYPDVRVVERAEFTSGGGGTAVAEIATEEPVVIEVATEPMRQGYIEIVDAGSGERVITVIEFLSLANKLKGEGRKQYRRKQHDCEQAGVSLVEIDLLREGKRVLAVPESRVPRRARTAYRICVRRGWRSTAVEVYPVPLRQRLPNIRVPLRRTDKDIPLQLQPLIDQAYKNGGYDDIDYADDPVPALKGDDLNWAEELLKGKRLR